MYKKPELSYYIIYVYFHPNIMKNIEWKHKFSVISISLSLSISLTLSAVGFTFHLLMLTTMS